MAIRGSKKESFRIKGDLQLVKNRILKSLQVSCFKKIKENSFLNEITASDNSITVVGKTRITLYAYSGFVQIEAEATENVDNIYALLPVLHKEY